jgi:hypothetical protein
MFHRASRPEWERTLWALGTNDGMMQVWLSMAYVLASVTIAVGMLLLASLPGARARARYHPAARRIALLGWVSLAVWPLWPVAMAWASWPRRRQPRPKVRIRVSPARAKIVGSIKLAEAHASQSA